MGRMSAGVAGRMSMTIRIRSNQVDSPIQRFKALSNRF
jgi:hypothetical protein